MVPVISVRFVLTRDLLFAIDEIDDRKTDQGRDKKRDGRSPIVRHLGTFKAQWFAPDDPNDREHKADTAHRADKLQK